MCVVGVQNVIGLIENKKLWKKYPKYDAFGFVKLQA
jgi:hypothetical protein